MERKRGRGVEGRIGGWKERRRGSVGDGWKNIAAYCWSQGVTMVMGERRKGMGE